MLSPYLFCGFSFPLGAPQNSLCDSLLEQTELSALRGAALLAEPKEPQVCLWDLTSPFEGQGAMIPY